MQKLENQNELLKQQTSKWEQLENQIAILKKQQDDLKQTLLDEMKKLGIARLESEDGLVIDYYPESIARTIDSARLKKEQPEIVELYSKATTKKEYIKVWRRKSTNDTMENL